MTKETYEQKSNKGPKWVHGIYGGKSGTGNKGNILQGPGYNKERRDEQVQSRDTGNSIVRSRLVMASG